MYTKDNIEELIEEVLSEKRITEYACIYRDGNKMLKAVKFDMYEYLKEKLPENLDGKR